MGYVFCHALATNGKHPQDILIHVSGMGVLNPFLGTYFLKNLSSSLFCKTIFATLIFFSNVFAMAFLSVAFG